MSPVLWRHVTPASVSVSLMPVSAGARTSRRWHSAGRQTPFPSVTVAAMPQSPRSVFDGCRRFQRKAMEGIALHIRRSSSASVLPASFPTLDFVPDDVVIVDCETTGRWMRGNYRKYRVVEVAAILVRGYQVVDSFSSLVNPLAGIATIPGDPAPLPLVWGADVQAVIGISDEMIRSAPDSASVMRTLADFIGDTTLVAHNAAFDTSFLGWEMRHCGLASLPRSLAAVDTLPQAVDDAAPDAGDQQPQQSVERTGNSAAALSSASAGLPRVICTLKLARRCFPGMESFKLSDIAHALGTDPGRSHRAFDDALATAKVWNIMMARIQEISPSKAFPSLQLLDLLQNNSAKEPLEAFLRRNASSMEGNSDGSNLGFFHA